MSQASESLASATGVPRAGTGAGVRRRRLLGLLAVLPLALGAAACGGSEPSGSAAVDDTTKHTNLRVASFGGALQDTLQELYKPFEQKYNVTIEWVAGTATENVAKAEAAKSKPEFDVIFTEDTNQYSASSKGLLAQLDPAIVTNLKDLAELGRGTNNDGVATGLNPTALYYNTKEFEKNKWAPPTTWADLKKPEYCKRIGLTDPNVTYTLHLAQMLGGGETSDIENGLDQLVKLGKKCVPVFEKSSSALEQKLQLGQDAVGAYGTTRLGPLSKSYPIKVVYPTEGMIGLSMISPVKDAPNARLAQEFVNWVLRPETQQQLIDQLGYYPSNVTVKSTPTFAGAATLEQLERWKKADAKVISENRKRWAEEFAKALS